ncbi:MAG: hypothetical protein EHM33_00765 [Chloroflexi bacterium]|nr:MAG: hypothetical protein EHM33_00765 [Chloroflexota bacterium]
MDTKIIELRTAVKALPTDNKQVQLAVKAEVLRLAELIDKQLSRPIDDACTCWLDSSAPDVADLHIAPCPLAAESGTVPAEKGE